MLCLSWERHHSELIGLSVIHVIATEQQKKQTEEERVRQELR